MIDARAEELEVPHYAGSFILNCGFIQCKLLAVLEKVHGLSKNSLHSFVWVTP